MQTAPTKHPAQRSVKRSVRPSDARRRTRRRRAIVLVLVVVLAGWLYWQQNGLSTETEIVKGAPEGFSGFRIAILADLHGKEFGSDNRRLLAFVEDLHPDLIAIPGDLIHEPEQLEMVPALARGLAAIAPSYYVTGNHEWASGTVQEVESLLESCGVTVLSNTYERLTRGGSSLALLGAEDLNGYADQKTVGELAEEVRREQGEAVYTLLLSHRNNEYPRYAAAGIDLTLAGHGHGGIIRLPGTDGLVGPGRTLWPDHTAGRYDLSQGQMVVSRGLGSKFPQFRLFNRPDIPLVVLNSPA